MPFFGQDVDPLGKTEGQRLAVPVREGLLKQEDIGKDLPWTWSKAHMLIGEKEDRQKYSAKEDPIATEDRIPVMQGWDHLASAYAIARLTAEMRSLQRAPNKNETSDALLAAYAREIVKGKKKSYEADFHDEFAHRFREWLRGNGSNDEYREAGMLSYVDGIGNKRHTNKPISDHPSVIRYLADWQNRVIEYDKKRTLMKLRMGRQGPKGEAASIDDLWKYYKFVVYGVEATDTEMAGADAAIDDAQDSAMDHTVTAPSGPVPVVPTPAPLAPDPPVPPAPPANSVQEMVREIEVGPIDEGVLRELERQEEMQRREMEQKQLEEQRAKEQAEAKQRALDEVKAAAEQELAKIVQKLQADAEQRINSEREARELAQKNAQELAQKLQAEAEQRINTERQARELAQKTAQELAQSLQIANSTLLGNQENASNQIRSAEQLAQDAINENAALKAQLEETKKALADMRGALNFLRRSTTTVAPEPAPAAAPPASAPPAHVLPEQPPHIGGPMQQVDAADIERIRQENLRKLEEDEKRRAEEAARQAEWVRQQQALLEQQQRDQELAKKLQEEERRRAELKTSGRGRAPERDADQPVRPAKKSLTPAPKPAPAAVPAPAAPPAGPITNAPEITVAGQLKNQYKYYAQHDVETLPASDLVGPDTPFLASKKLTRKGKEYHRRAFNTIAEIIEQDGDPDHWQGKVTSALFPDGGEEDPADKVDGERKIDIVKRYLRYIASQK